MIFNKSTAPVPAVANPRNVVIQWEAPEVKVRKEIKYLGVIKANPFEYVKRYGVILKTADQMPQYVKDIQTPSEIGVLAADYNVSNVPQLEGELEGFKFVDLDKEGMSEYKAQLNNLGNYKN